MVKLVTISGREMCKLLGKLGFEKIYWKGSHFNFSLRYIYNINWLLFKMDVKYIKSQSQVVTAVLLILIGIALAVIILNFSTNFVKDKLSETGCFEAVNQVIFTNSNKYTCFNDSNNGGSDNDDMLLQVHIGDNSSIVGFLIETGGANTQSIEIKNEKVIEGVNMYGGDVNLKIPGKNEERTYVFAMTTKPESIKIYPILNDAQVCEASDILESIVLCRWFCEPSDIIETISLCKN